MSSIKETISHINMVRHLLTSFIKVFIGRNSIEMIDENSSAFKVVQELTQRSLVHDKSKTVEPELSMFDKYTATLKNTTYGSKEYFDILDEMKLDALPAHYEANRHHPEHFEKGIAEMTVIDLSEMLMDWWAATKRHKDGDIYKSIEINQERFGYDDKLKEVFVNTIRVLDLGEDVATKKVETLWDLLVEDKKEKEDKAKEVKN